MWGKIKANKNNALPHNCIGSTLSIGIVGNEKLSKEIKPLKNINPNISEKGELWAARISIAVAVVAAGLAGLNPPGFVAEVVALAFGLAASSFFPAIILGIFDKRMNKEGALSGMIVGVVFTTIYIFYFKPQLGGPGLPQNYLFGISPEGIGTIGMIINFIVSLIVSRLTQPTPENIKELVESIRYPK